MTSDRQTTGRREFLAQSAALLATPMLWSTTARGQERAPAASDRINVGVIGLGSRGFNLLDDLLAHPQAQIVMICDVDEFHYRDRPWGQGPMFGREPAKAHIEKKSPGSRGLAVTSDFREVCARKDIDAVVIATPDHWHALCTLEALRHGKDVYCEKPVTHTFHEGTLIVNEVAKQKAVFQTGSQQRSEANFRRAVELVRNGHLGKIERVEVGLPPGYDKPQGDTAVVTPPQGLNYDFWCGPAPQLPYMRARHHRWWRGHRAFGGGVLMDWIGHHNDIAHWALDLDQSGPIRVAAVNWSYPETDVYNTPIQYEIHCDYASGVRSVISSGNPIGTKIIGSEGWLYVTRGKLQASDSRWTAESFQVGSQKVYASDDHMGNFLDCVKSRRPCVAPAETAHRSITPGHLAYVSQQLGTALDWDPAQQTFVNHDEANRLLHLNPYRAPWDQVVTQA